MDVLRLITCGNVDDGKSTLLGRLLHDTKSIYEDQWEATHRASLQRGDATTNLALLTDGLRAERERGITIDVAYRYFSTPRRKFVLADCPGHAEFTRNMVTGASTAQLALLLIDVRKGLTEQTCRHAFLCTLLRIKHLVVCVNKMDLVDFSAEAFERVCEQFRTYAERLDAADIQFVPIAALPGDNVVEKSPRMPWFHGTPLLYLLENVYVRNDANHVDARLPIQLVLSADPNLDRARPMLAGQIASGIFRPGDVILHLPSGQQAQIQSLAGPNGALVEAFHPMSVMLTLDRDLPVRRGDLLARPLNHPQPTREIDAMLCWFADTPSADGQTYVLRHATRETHCRITAIRYHLDVVSLHRFAQDGPLATNNVARVCLRTEEAIFADTYRQNRQQGSLSLIDPVSGTTVAAAMIL